MIFNQLAIGAKFRIAGYSPIYIKTGTRAYRSVHTSHDASFPDGFDDAFEVVPV